MSNITLADKLSIITQNQQIIAENQEKVYNAGYEKGKAESDGDSYYDTFWDTFQNNGEPRDYYDAFTNNRFNDDSYNPKYSIICGGSNGARYMFYNSNSITETKVPIDVTQATGDLHYAFGAYGMAQGLKKIQQLIVDEDTVFNTTAFNRASSLSYIRIAGKIGQSLSFQWSPLDRESILSVYDALSTTATGQTCTFNKTAVNAAFTTEEWEALTNAKNNWTFTLS